MLARLSTPYCAEKHQAGERLLAGVTDEHTTRLNFAKIDVIVSCSATDADGFDVSRLHIGMRGGSRHDGIHRFLRIDRFHQVVQE
jgi:hypothetical protein